MFCSSLSSRAKRADGSEQGRRRRREDADDAAGHGPDDDAVAQVLADDLIGAGEAEPDPEDDALAPVFQELDVATESELNALGDAELGRLVPPALAPLGENTAEMPGMEEVLAGSAAIEEDSNCRCKL